MHDGRAPAHRNAATTSRRSCCTPTPYRETSLIVEAFTAELRPRGDGRARRQAPALGDCAACCRRSSRSLLSWAGSGELKTLLKAEWRGGLPLLGGSALLCGFYLNELLLKLLPREDPHPRAVRRLRGGAGRACRERGAAQAAVLRRFEVRLLAELGYALPLDARRRHRRARSIPPRATITRSTAARGASPHVAREPGARCRARARRDAAGARRRRAIPTPRRRPRRSG